jgi:hypothetical protein
LPGRALCRVALFLARRHSDAAGLASASVDYEYVRKGTANIFCIVEPKTGRRLTHATKAARIHLVVDNLSTHSLNCLVTALGPLEGRRLWRRFDVHFTPKHGSWLNAAEMEASLVSRERLGSRRTESLQELTSEVTAWNRGADCSHRPINWTFRVHDARRVFRYHGIATARSQH